MGKVVKVLEKGSCASQTDIQGLIDIRKRLQPLVVKSNGRGHLLRRARGCPAVVFPDPYEEHWLDGIANAIYKDDNLWNGLSI